MHVQEEFTFAELLWLAEESGNPMAKYSACALAPKGTKAQPKRSLAGLNGDIVAEAEALANGIAAPSAFFGIDIVTPGGQSTMLIYPTSEGPLIVVPHDDGADISWPADIATVLHDVQGLIPHGAQRSDASAVLGPASLTALAELIDEFRRAQLTGLAKGEVGDVPVLTSDRLQNLLTQRREEASWIRAHVAEELKNYSEDMSGRQLDVDTAMGDLATLSCITRAGSGYVLAEPWQQLAASMLVPDAVIVFTGYQQGDQGFSSVRYVKSGQNGLLRIEVVGEKGELRACDASELMGSMLTYAGTIGYKSAPDDERDEADSSEVSAPPPIPSSPEPGPPPTSGPSPDEKPKKKGRISTGIMWFAIFGITVVAPVPPRIKLIALVGLTIGLIVSSVAGLRKK